jgi:hypothetical protein
MTLLGWSRTTNKVILIDGTVLADRDDSPRPDSEPNSRDR